MTDESGKGGGYRSVGDGCSARLNLVSFSEYAGQDGVGIHFVMNKGGKALIEDVSFEGCENKNGNEADIVYHMRSTHLMIRISEAMLV